MQTTKQSNMKITLTKTESETMFHNALCNALGTGYMAGYGLVLETHDAEYNAAKNALKQRGESPCYEDVLLEILRQGGTLWFVDAEDDGETIAEITLNDVHERVANTPVEHLVDMVNETDDAVTADVIIQTVFFNEVVYG